MTEPNKEPEDGGSPLIESAEFSLSVHRARAGGWIWRTKRSFSKSAMISFILPLGPVACGYPIRWHRQRTFVALQKALWDSTGLQVVRSSRGFLQKPRREAVLTAFCRQRHRNGEKE